MTRVKRGVTQTRRHKKFLKLAKGSRLGRSKLYAEARRTVMKGGTYAYTHRRQNRRFYRGLWITRINAALKEHGMNYSRFVNALFMKHVDLDRKILAYFAAEKPTIFAEVVKAVK